MKHWIKQCAVILFLSLSIPLLAQPAEPAEHAEKEKLKEETIVLQIRNDGTVMVGGVIVLDGEDDIIAYVTQQRKRITEKGLEPKLHMKGPKEALFNHSRPVIIASFKAGVEQIAFVPDVEIAPAHAAAEKPPQGLEAKPPTQVTIGIGADDRIAMDGRAADGGPDDRELAQLNEMLEAQIKNHPLGHEGIQISILTDPGGSHQRIIDVITVLMRLELKKVTFTPDPQ